jgi:hypothetical protein
MQKGQEEAISSLLRVISVDTLVFRRNGSITTNLIRLRGVHAQNSCKGEHS